MPPLPRALAFVLAGSLFCAAPAAAQEEIRKHDHAITAVRVGVLSAQMFDLSTTTYGIGAGVVSESNPLMRWMADEPMALAAMKLGTAAALDWSVRRVARSGQRKTAFVLGIGLAASTLAVSLHNMQKIRGAQR